MTILGDYYYLKGIDFCNAPDNGVKVEGSHNTFDQCIFHNNGDSGLQIGLWKTKPLPENADGEKSAYNIVLNRDAYRNADPATAYENADGFACKLYAGKGNVFRGCRAWENCDDGWDFFMTEFEIRVENCWSFHNGDQKIWGQDSSRWNGDGNGFKLGGDTLKSPNVAINCIAFDSYFGAMCGFNSNNNGTGIRLYNCTAWKCGKNFKMVDKVHILKNCLAFDPVSGKNFNADLTEQVIALNNSWNLTNVTPSYDDLISTSMEDALAPRQADGSLPNNGFGRLKPGSDCIDKGITTEGMPFSGLSPDLGAYEMGAVGIHSYRVQTKAPILFNRKTAPAVIVNLAGSTIGNVINKKHQKYVENIHIYTWPAMQSVKTVNIVR